METIGRAEAGGTTERRDQGFTLIELLIVIVILGILATVTVFAVRGISDQAEQNACASEFRTVETAIESYYLLNGSYGTETDLVSAGVLRDESPRFNVANQGGGYQVDPDLTSTCTESASAAGSTPPPVVNNTPPPTNVNFHGASAYRYEFDSQVNGNPGQNHEILIIGSATASADVQAAIAAMTPSVWRVHFIHLSDIPTTDPLLTGNVNSGNGVLKNAHNSGNTVIAIYGADDTAPILDGGGTAYTSVTDFVTQAISAEPRMSVVPAGPGTLAGLLTAPLP